MYDCFCNETSHTYILLNFIPFYDNELITRAAKESGFAEETFARAEDKATNSLLYSLAMGINVYGNQDFGFSGLSLDDRIFLAQSDVIRKVADDGPCVIVGRCADYVLKERTNTFNVFVQASLDFRLKRVVENYGESEKKAGEIILKNDKRRANTLHRFINTGNITADNHIVVGQIRPLLTHMIIIVVCTYLGE